MLIINQKSMQMLLHSRNVLYIRLTSTLSRIVRSIILLLVSMYICYVHLNTTHNGNPICANFQNTLKQELSFRIIFTPYLIFLENKYCYT